MYNIIPLIFFKILLVLLKPRPAARATPRLPSPLCPGRSLPPTTSTHKCQHHDHPGSGGSSAQIQRVPWGEWHASSVHAGDVPALATQMLDAADVTFQLQRDEEARSILTPHLRACVPFAGHHPCRNAGGSTQAPQGVRGNM